MKKNGFEKLHTADDADCLMVKKALNLAKETVIPVVGEDTDLLILLLFHVQPEHSKVLLHVHHKVCSQNLGHKSSPASIRSS